MKRNIFINIATIILSLALLVTLSYAWWIGGAASNSVIIKTANIASRVTTYKGEDFNRDGSLDLDTAGLPIFTEIEHKKTENEGKPANITLEMLDIAPGEVFTWKASILNQGDTSGFVRATISSKLDVTNPENALLIKYLSVSVAGGTNKIYIIDILNNTSTNKNLFGGTVDDEVKVNLSKDYVFQIELVMYDELVRLGKITDTPEESALYNSLQGKVSTQIFIDLALESTRPKEYLPLT